MGERLDTLRETAEEKATAVDRYIGEGIERATKTFIGPHSYRTHEDRDELEDDIYRYRPAKTGETKEEYFEDLHTLAEYRRDRLEDMYEIAKQEETSLTEDLRLRYEAARTEEDETIYIAARSMMVIGGLGGVTSGNFWATVLGAPALLGSPLGVPGAYNDIQTFMDEDVLETEIELYDELLDEMDEEGETMLPDQLSEKIEVPGLGKKKISFEFSDGEYQRDVLYPGEAIAEATATTKDISTKLKDSVTDLGTGFKDRYF